jgi:hypothetical protein
MGALQHRLDFGGPGLRREGSERLQAETEFPIDALNRRAQTGSKAVGGGVVIGERQYRPGSERHRHVMDDGPVALDVVGKRGGACQPNPA